jgi:glycosyltransferase involved in cell wall biosynthesis
MLLAEPDDHRALARLLESLVADRGRLSSLGQAARSTVERHFTWTHCGKATVDAYRAAMELVRRAPGSPRY